MFSAYILGQDGCLWKNNLEILWSHSMKNFQVKHGQYDNIIFSETFYFESSKYVSDISPLVTTGFFWKALESIYKFIIEVYALQVLFVRGLMNRKRRVGLFRISQGRDFLHLL